MFVFVATPSANQNNERFANYCPYCQISNTPSVLPQTLKEPPGYTSLPSSSSRTAEVSGAPPPYTRHSTAKALTGDDEKAALAALDQQDAAEDVLHFLNDEYDSIASLSLRYGVPAAVLRSTNMITSDNLLLGRRTVLIPGEYYKGGVSLSPRPVEGEEEERRKGKIRRFMTSCKVSDYDIALLYLEQASYDLQVATEAYFDDEEWEKAHPHETGGKGKATKQPKNRGPFWRGSA
ncbi:Fc.00g110110.m01.CDS01 [Cosmosporella sp. VM-42]